MTTTETETRKPVFEQLLIDAESEKSVFRRFSPRRHRWAEIGEFDRRVEELEQRQAGINDELTARHEQLRQAELADRERLALWTATLEGERPEPEAPGLQEQIDRLVEDRAALSFAVVGVLVEKEKFVARHRKRLEREAGQAKEKALDRYRRLLGEAEEARAEALELRSAEVWAGLFPSPVANNNPGPPGLLLGGLRQKAIPGVVTQLAASQVMQLLRDDADWLNSAADQEQRRQLEGPEPADPRKQAVWDGSREAQEAERKEKQEAIERYRHEWGVDP